MLGDFPWRGLRVIVHSKASKSQLFFAVHFGLQIKGLQYNYGREAADQMNKKDVVQLHDGAVVAFEEYGDPTGTPVIFCHGWPSSRTMAQLTDEPARSLGIRIISPDRPGISGSTMHARSKVERLAVTCSTAC